VARVRLEVNVIGGRASSWGASETVPTSLILFRPCGWSQTEDMILAVAEQSQTNVADSLSGSGLALCNIRR